jgi:hypothetical protein
MLEGTGYEDGIGVEVMYYERREQRTRLLGICAFHAYFWSAAATACPLELKVVAFAGPHHGHFKATHTGALCSILETDFGTIFLCHDFCIFFVYEKRVFNSFNA